MFAAKGLLYGVMIKIITAQLGHGLNIKRSAARLALHFLDEGQPRLPIAGTKPHQHTIFFAKRFEKVWACAAQKHLNTHQGMFAHTHQFNIGQ